MPDIAALNLAVDSDPVKQATVELNALTKASMASERAAEKWGMTTSAAAKSADDFSKRVQGTIKSLEFERAQLTRSAAEQEKFAAIRRAGVSAMSAEGKAIADSVAALQAQRAAAANSNAAAQAGVGLFGQITDKIKGYGAALTVAAIATAALAEGKKIEDYALTIDKLARSLKVSTLEAQALEAASRQTGKSAEDLNAQLSAGQKTLLTNVYKAAFGDTTTTLENVSSASKRLTDAWNDMAEAGQQSMVSMFGDITASTLNALADAVRWWGGAIRDASAALARLPGQITQGTNAVTLDATGGFSISGTQEVVEHSTAQDILRGKIDDSRASIAKLGEQLTATRDEMARDGDRAGMLSADIANFEARVASLTVRLSELLPQLKALAAAGTQSLFGAAQNAIPTFQGAGPNVLAPYLPGPSQITRWMTEGLKPPVTGGGASSGKSDNDSVDAQIKRYQALGDVAKRAGDTISANRQKNIEDLQREVRVQEQVEEIAAKLGAKYADADQARKDQLHTEIALYEQRKAANQLALESAQKAEDIEVKLGDGTRARAVLERDLARAQDTGRVSAEALLRVEKQRREEIDQAALAAQRYDDSLGSLAAGYEHAANAARRNNDLFSQGTQLYDLQREAFSGFFSDMVSGLQQGQSAWAAFGTAATNALNKIADKLLSMAVDNLFNSAFPGGGGLGGLLGNFFGAGAPWGFGNQGGADAIMGLNANGNAFLRGNVIPFARGGIVHRPTLFPMANGAGLMGEAGPEAVMPLRRGRGGRLGVESSGGGGGDVVVNINNYTDSSVSTRKSKSPSGNMQIDVIVEAVEGKMSNRLSRGQGSLGKTIEGTYGVARQGR